jgi:hypothetical protein
MTLSVISLDVTVNCPIVPPGVCATIRAVSERRDQLALRGQAEAPLTATLTIGLRTAGKHANASPLTSALSGA